MQNDVVKPPVDNPPAPAGPQPEPKPIQDIAKPAEPQISEPTPTEQQAQPQDAAALEPEAADQAKHEEPQPPKAKSSLPKGIIAVAGVVCVALVGAVLYLTVSGPEEAQAPAPATQKQSVSAEDVKATADEANDLPEADADLSPELTDQSLGL